MPRQAGEPLSSLRRSAQKLNEAPVYRAGRAILEHTQHALLVQPPDAEDPGAAVAEQPIFLSPARAHDFQPALPHHMRFFSSTLCLNAVLFTRSLTGGLALRSRTNI